MSNEPNIEHIIIDAFELTKRCIAIRFSTNSFFMLNATLKV